MATVASVPLFNQTKSRLPASIQAKGMLYKQLCKLCRYYTNCVLFLQMFWLPSERSPSKPSCHQSVPHLTSLSKSQTSLLPNNRDEPKLKLAVSTQQQQQTSVIKKNNEALKIFNNSSSQLSTKQQSPAYADYENYFYIWNLYSYCYYIVYKYRFFCVWCLVWFWMW